MFKGVFNAGFLKINSRKRSLSFNEELPTPLDFASVYRISPNDLHGFYSIISPHGI